MDPFGDYIEDQREVNQATVTLHSFHQPNPHSSFGKLHIFYDDIIDYDNKDVWERDYTLTSEHSFIWPF